MKLFRRRSQQGPRSRRAVAAVEFALCLPVMVLLVMGLIETCTMVFLKQSLTVAAYEGAHTALQPHATPRDVRRACKQILRDRRVQDAKIRISPNNIVRLSPGEFFEVRISAPSDSNNVLPARFFRGKTISASAVMMMEM